MSTYTDALLKEDPRINEIFDVAAETTQHLGSVLIEDPFPHFARLLEQAPVHAAPLATLMGYDASASHFHYHIKDRPVYSALSFSAVSRVFIENNIFSSDAYNLYSSTPSTVGDTIINKTGPTHRMYRDPIQPMFSPDAASKWWSEKVIDETVDALIANIEGKGEADLFLDLCARMPVNVISAGFGLDPDDIITFRIALLEMTRVTATITERQEASETTNNILRRAIAERRKTSADDIISRLVEAEIQLENGGTRPFTDAEIIAHCRLIVLAGGGTTWRQLGITLFALLNNPDQLDLLRADRGLMPRVILEAARWHPTDLLFPRFTREDVELEGVLIPKASMVHACVGAANRDPSRWDNPDKFDITRSVQRGVAFGAGPHSCLGQHVSRQEMVTAVNAVLDRLPNLRWNPAKPPAKIVGSLFQRGPTALPVVFG